MKKNSLRILSVFLCIVMMVCLLPVSAFADSSMSRYKVYTVLGDSNPSGFGLDAYYQNAGGMKIKDGDLIHGTYPAIVAEDVGAEKVNVYSHCAWRVNELLRVIDPAFNWNDGFSNTYYTGLYYDGRFGFDTDAFAAKIPAAIKEADLITLQYGSNDIFTHAVNRTTDKFPDLLDSLKIQLPKDADESTLCNLLFAAADKAGILADVVLSFVNFMNDNCRIFKNNMAIALPKLREMNPDAEIYVVGVLNSLNQTYQSDNGLFLSLPTITDARIFEANCYLKQLCEKTEGCTYVDVPNTDMFGIKVLDLAETFDGDGVYYSALKIVHPTQKGHTYMANQIIKAIEGNAVGAPEVSVKKSTVLKKNVVSWNDIDGASMYRVYRSTSENGEYSYIGSTALNVFYDAIALSGTSHYYKVCAVLSYSSDIVTPMSAPAHAA